MVWVDNEPKSPSAEGWRVFFINMQEFYPKEIFIDRRVLDLPTTQRILAKYPKLPKKIISDRNEIKLPQVHTRAKQQLYLAAFQGEALKTCQGSGDYVCCQYYTISLVSDCHLECTYCILQDYLKNNPIITFYTNVADVFQEIENHIQKNPQKIFRIGTGELSDSLALDHITEFSKDFIGFANKHPNVVLELKTKTTNVQNLLELKHKKNVVVSWSINPQRYIEKEEHKCDSLTKRLAAARQCADAGYPVAFHLDPLLYFENWQTEYADVINQVQKLFLSKELAWVSLGSLRFTKELKKISQRRFPKSQIMTAEFGVSSDGKYRYYRPLREEMYRYLKNQIQSKLNKVPFYLCMETKSVWNQVFDSIPQDNAALENHLTEKFYQDLRSLHE